MGLGTQSIQQGLHHDNILLPLRNDVLTQIILQGQAVDFVNGSLHFKKVSELIFCEVFS